MAARKKAKKNVNKRVTKSPEKKNYFSTYMIVLSLITLFLGIFMYVGGEGGVINDAVKFSICGMFGKIGMILPIVLAGLTIYLGKYRDIKRFWLKTVFAVLMMINVGALIGLYYDYSISDAFFEGAHNYIGPGVFGASVAFAMKWLMRSVASYVVLSITMILLAGTVTGIDIFQKTWSFMRSGFSKAQEKYTDFKETHDWVYEEDEYDEKNPAIEAANSFAHDNEPLTNEKIKGKKKSKESDEEITSDEKIFSDGIDEVFGSMTDEPLTRKSIQKSDGKNEDIKKNSDGEESAQDKERAEKITEAEKAKYHDEFNAAIEKPVINYVFPPMSLLNNKKATSSDQRDEMRRTAEKLITILDDFGVKAKLLQVTQGPTVTRYEIQPDTGIKLSKIVGLADDLALNLAVSTVLVAPVPGKAAVGVEIPNKKVSSVSIREMLESSEFNNAKSKLTVALGKDIGGNVVVGDVAKWPHVLIAGATGSGKSVCINTIVTSILYKASPEDVKLIMVDPKVVELGVYNGIPHLLVPVVTDPKKAAGALNWAVTEMMRRYELFKDTGVRKLESYNKLMESTGGEKIPQLVIIIDELADLMMVAAKEVEDYICRLAQLARAAGIHLIIATQRPSVDVITGLIKANIPSRVAFAVSSQVDSRTIIDRGGAEKLLGMGDMLYYPTGSRAAIRVQGAFVSDEEIEKIIGFIKDSVGEMHYSDDLAEHIERCSTGENGVTPDVEEDGDALLPDAIDLAIELGKISTSMIQRRLGVGYSRAGRIIDQMEARGIISGANGSKPRDVLVSHADMALSMADDDTDEDEETD